MNFYFFVSYLHVFCKNAPYHIIVQIYEGNMLVRWHCCKGSFTNFFRFKLYTMSGYLIFFPTHPMKEVSSALRIRPYILLNNFY